MLGRFSSHQHTTHQETDTRHTKHSYAHFLMPTHSFNEDAIQKTAQCGYDPYCVEGAMEGSYSMPPTSATSAPTSMRPSDMKREANEQFRLAHPDIHAEMTLSKIRTVKSNLLEAARAVDLEISTIAHAYVYFEKLVLKNLVTKKNRKLVGACCLFLAAKANEPKGSWFQALLEAMDDQLDVDSEEVRENEFMVFTDLEFNLFLPRHEYMPHFERIFKTLDYKSVEEYLGNEAFYDIDYH
ncbi:cyclin-like protein [Spinellus fusiger]|nr:cyclin-like protein [Spinellus fusiger]